MTADPSLVAAIRGFLAQPRARREASRVGKGKLHDVYRVEHAGTSYFVKVRGRETPWVRLVNWYKGTRHYAETGEITRLRRARVADRWNTERVTAEGWRAHGLSGPTFLDWPDENVRVSLGFEFGTLSEHLRDSTLDRKFKLFSLMEVAGFMFARHTMVSAASNPHLFHEEPHTENLLYRPGELIYLDQEFLPDETKPDIHHAAVELICLAQSALRDLQYEDPPEIMAAIAHGYPDPQILETAARLLEVRRTVSKLGRRNYPPLSNGELAALFRLHAVPEVRQRPDSRPTPLGMPGDLTQRPRSNELG